METHKKTNTLYTRREFLRSSAGAFLSVLFTSIFGPPLKGCSSGTGDGDLLRGLEAFTTLERTLVPALPARDITDGSFPNPAADPAALESAYQSGYGRLEFGPGEKRVLRSELADDLGKAVRRRLTNLFHLTDIHLTDEESPARMCGLDNKEISAALRPQEHYIPHVLDAAIRTIRTLSRNIPTDLVLFTGDIIDNHQMNELKWFLEVLEGKRVVPDSDLKDSIAAYPLHFTASDGTDRYIY